MHDLKFANEILLALNKKFPLGAPQKSVVINARLDPLSHVRPEGLKETFGVILPEGHFKKARLEIKPLEFGVRCRTCLREYKSSEPVFACRHCDSADFDIVREAEFKIESIETE